MFKIIFYSTIAIICASCIKEVDNVKLPGNHREKLVVECFISPESDTVSAIVTLSLPIFGESRNRDIKPLPNATVTLSDGNNSVILPFDDEKKIYFSDALSFDIVPGKMYYLTVSTSDGNVANAQCTVPLNAALPTSLSLTKESTELYSSEANVKAEWQDLAGEKNYYLVTIFSDMSSAYQSFTSELYLNNNLLSDEQLDGKLITYREDYVYIPSHVDSTYMLNLHTLDFNTYEFKRTQQLNYDEGAFSTPVNVHSNIKNGLGVFGAYRKMSLVRTRQVSVSE